jgi:acetyltransferase-like isoleucine patch superfamily enzyme
MREINLAISSLWYAFILFLPDEFSKIRVRYYNRKGCKIHKRTSSSPNVRIRGKFEMDEGSSIAQNCTISGEKTGVFIGENVMIAPNVVIIAFNHGYEQTDKPMVYQKNVEVAVVIEDDVWMAANCTIGKGVLIRTGAVVAANSFVGKDDAPYTSVGGVPAKVIGKRINQSEN